MAKNLPVLRTWIYLSSGKSRSYSLQLWTTNGTHAGLHLSHLLWSSWQAISEVDLDYKCQITRHHLHEPKVEGVSGLYT